DLIGTHRKQPHIVAAALIAHDVARQATLGMLDDDSHSRYQRPRHVPHDTQNGCRGGLSKNRVGSQCDQHKNRYYKSSRRRQTSASPPYHIPLLSNANLQIRKINMAGVRASVLVPPWSVHCFMKQVVLTAVSGNQRSLQLVRLLMAK